MGGRIKTDGLFLFLIAVSVIILPLKWLFAWLLAAVIHECCHCLALKCLGHRILRFQIGIGGAKIDTEPMRSRDALICTLAGPAGSFLLLLFLRYFPLIAICGFVQGVYNLLPLTSADGGQAITIAINRLLPGKWGRGVLKAIRRTISACLLFSGVCILIFYHKIVPLIVALMIIIKDRKKTLQKLSQEGTIVLPE